MEQYEIDELAEQPWEETLDVLTADMDPQSIDIAVLADRYREYIEELESFDLEVPARAVRLLAALLRFKTLAIAGEEVREDEPEENPMDFEEEEVVEEEQLPELETGPELEMPVRPKPRRRMSLDELKDALGDAMEVKEQREERQQMRQEIDDHLEVDEKSLNQKINSLFSRLTDLVGNSSDQIDFDKLVEENESEERIEKFLHVLHLETDQKVECIQNEWLGDLKVRPTEENEKVAN